MLIGENPIGSRPGIGESYIVQTKTYTMDQWSVFIQSEPLSEEKTRYYHSRNYGIYIVSLHGLINYNMGYAATSSTNVATYMLSTGIKDTLRSILMSTTLVPAYELTIPSTSVISTLVWSWAETFDSVWRKMETMSNALKIEYATDTYLDEAWGKIFDLPRIYQETDTQYRDRLKTRTTILTSSGTKSNCETIIDSIIGEMGVTTVTTRYPSTVQITFSTIDAMRIAKEKQDTLNYLIPQMIAAGISYNMYLPFIDYFMEAYINGPLTLSHTMQYALLYKNSDLTYNTNIISSIQPEFYYAIDVTTMNYNITQFLIGSLFSIEKLKTYSILVGLFGTQNKSLLMNNVSKKNNIIKQIIIDQYLQKFNLHKQYNLSMLSSANPRRIYTMSNTLTYQLISNYDLDAILKLYVISFSMDVCNERTYPKRHTMAITLVGA